MSKYTRSIYSLIVCLFLLCSVNVQAIETERLDESSDYDEAASTELNSKIDQKVDAITDTLEKNITTTSSQPIEEDTSVFENTLNSATTTEKANYNEIRSNNFVQNLGVVQKNILTKTNRIHFFGGISLIPTEVYYRTLGAQLNISYHLNETYGVGAFGYFFEAFDRGEINDLQNKQSVSVESLLYLKNYSGLSLYYNKIHGKMTFFNQKIVPFEIFFNAGVGQVNTKTSSASTGVHLGLGSLYTLDADAGVRFDLNWVFYQAKNINGETQNANSMMLTVGYSGFFLEGLKK